MSKLTVYSTTICQRCRTAKRALDQKGIPYEEVNVEHDPEAAERLKRNGMTEAPVFGFDGKLHTMAGLSDIIRKIQEEAA